MGTESMTINTGFVSEAMNAPIKEGFIVRASMGYNRWSSSTYRCKHSESNI